jgi:hypothetical protein
MAVQLSGFQAGRASYGRQLSPNQLWQHPKPVGNKLILARIVVVLGAFFSPFFFFFVIAVLFVFFLLSHNNRKVWHKLLT